MQLKKIKGFESTPCAKRAAVAVTSRVDAASLFSVEGPSLAAQAALSKPTATGAHR